MQFAWTTISLREILKEIEQETILSTHSNTLLANSELINSSIKASSLGNLFLKDSYFHKNKFLF